jgi:hypothetical protein
MGGRGSGSQGSTNAGVSAVSAKHEVPAATSEYMDRVNGDKKKLNREAQAKLQKKVEKEAIAIADLKGYLTSAEEKAVNIYTSKEYQKINGDLRSGKMDAKTKAVVDKMDSALKNNVLKRDVIVYRGTNGEFGVDKAYTSTSTNPLTAGNFARGGQAKIRAYVIPKGTHAIVVGGGEGEIILPRGFDLKKHRIK